TAQQIEQEISTVAQPVLDVVAEDGEEPHVPQDVEEATVEEAGGDQGDEAPGIERRAAQLHPAKEGPGDEAEHLDELVQLPGAEAELEEEDHHVDGDEQPGDHRDGAGTGAVAKGNHVPELPNLRCPPAARAPVLVGSAAR